MGSRDHAGALRHVRWIGGGSGAGKSTVSRQLTADHGLRLYHAEPFVRASSIRDRVEPDPTRSFGLYLDMRWLPTWPAEVIEWPDYGIPADRERAAVQIVSAFARARRGELVEVGCTGGLGRTGTVLACMAVLAGEPPASAVDWVRRAYNPAAVETSAQQQWVRWFADRVSDGS